MYIKISWGPNPEDNCLEDGVVPTWTQLNKQLNKKSITWKSHRFYRIPSPQLAFWHRSQWQQPKHVINIKRKGEIIATSTNWLDFLSSGRMDKNSIKYNTGAKLEKPKISPDSSTSFLTIMINPTHFDWISVINCASNLSKIEDYFNYFYKKYILNAVLKGDFWGLQHWLSKLKPEHMDVCYSVQQLKTAHHDAGSNSKGCLVCLILLNH